MSRIDNNLDASGKTLDKTSKTIKKLKFNIFGFMVGGKDKNEEDQKPAKVKGTDFKTAEVGKAQQIKLDMITTDHQDQELEVQKNLQTVSDNLAILEAQAATHGNIIKAQNEDITKLGGKMKKLDKNVKGQTNDLEKMLK